LDAQSKWGYFGADRSIRVSIAHILILMSHLVANAARLIAEPARAAMLVRLMGGRAVPAGELALIAHVSPQTASEHLSRLNEAGFITVQRLGRHRYYKLANEEVAYVVESLLVLSAAEGRQTRRLSEAWSTRVPVMRTSPDGPVSRSPTRWCERAILSQAEAQPSPSPTAAKPGSPNKA
jgi:DNA-binding transcriptional ArsR family regulator